MRTMILGAAVLLVAVGTGPATAADAPVSCADVAVAMDEGGGGVSADQIAAKLKIPVEQVRKCMDKEDAGFPSGDTGVAPAKKKDAPH